MKTLGVIIAGGKSTRMGQDKAFVNWNGKSLIAHVAERLGPQVDQLIVNANGDPARFAFPVIMDITDTGTPVAGLHAALRFAESKGFDAVVTAPCDTPLLPRDLVARLQGDGAAIAASGGQSHYLTGFWPVECLSALKGVIRAKDFAAATNARIVAWPLTPHDPFANINTPEDLDKLSA